VTTGRRAIAKVAQAAQVVERVRDSGVVAVFRVDSPDGIVAACRVLADEGVRAVEVTMTTPGALAVVSELRATLGDELVVAAGTVLGVVACAEAVDAGAQLVVSPALEPEVVALCGRHGVAVAAGALTPTEVVAAMTAGADLVKLFPARVATPAYLADLLGPLPGLRAVPTGGLDEEAAKAYFEAGAFAVGVGSRLVAPDAVRSGDLDAVRATARRFRAVVDARERRAG
jgi:2-dehydro-3-deoxyphosphogluconate aldolase / (4S)-4-hydroxy-2-oxoglutarate aldolase